MKGVRRALLRLPNWLGDTVMAVPALRALRAALPGAEILCQGPWAAALLEAEPGIARRLHPGRGWRERIRIAREVGRAGVDLVVLTTNSLGTAILGRLTGAPRRIGYRADGRGWLLTDPLDPPTGWTHQVDAYLGLLAPLGVTGAGAAPTLGVTPARREEARRLLGTIGIEPGSRAVAIQLGAAFGVSKLWPADRLATLAERLEGERATAVFLGSPAEAPLLAAVAGCMATPPRSLVGRDHPALLPALLGEFQALVAPDTGPAHVAAAVGVPTVTLFGPTDPRLTAPRHAASVALWQAPACAPCLRARCPIDHRCLRALGVDEVLAAVLARLP